MAQVSQGHNLKVMYHVRWKTSCQTWFYIYILSLIQSIHHYIYQSINQTDLPSLIKSIYHYTNQSINQATDLLSLIQSIYHYSNQSTNQSMAKRGLNHGIKSRWLCLKWFTPDSCSWTLQDQWSHYISITALFSSLDVFIEVKNDAPGVCRLFSAGISCQLTRPLHDGLHCRQPVLWCNKHCNSTSKNSKENMTNPNLNEWNANLCTVPVFIYPIISLSRERDRGTDRQTTRMTDRETYTHLQYCQYKLHARGSTVEKYHIMHYFYIYLFF